MLNKIIYNCGKIGGFIFDGSMSIYELVLKAIEKVNETVDYVLGLEKKVDANYKTLDSKIDKNYKTLDTKIDKNYVDLNTRKENSIDITTKRKLSPSGDFTGTLTGFTQVKVFSDINNALSLSQTLIDMVNDRESIGTIYDGGNYVDTEPPTITIEGGLY
jgi:hypothetical protein